MSDRPKLFFDKNFKAQCDFHRLGGDGTMRYAVFEPSSTPRGTFLIAQGRREFIEKKHLEAGRALLARGFRIILFDWRGQGLSSRFFDGTQRQLDHVTDFDIYTGDLRQFYHDIVKPHQSGPLFVLAHSMGGLIVTHWLAASADARSDIRAVIMTAPALALGVPPASYAISRIFTRLGAGARYAAGQHDYDDNDRRFTGNVLSHDRERFKVIEQYFDAHHDLKVGGVTWGWLAAALKSIRRLRQPGYLEHIRLPVLALFGGKDIVTPPAKIIPLIRRMPNAEAVLIPGARHDLLNEADRYRDETWWHVDGFLKQIIRE